MRRKPRAIASLCCRRPANAKSSRFGNESRPVSIQAIATSQVFSGARAAGAPIRPRLRRAFRELYVILVDRHPSRLVVPYWNRPGKALDLVVVLPFCRYPILFRLFSGGVLTRQRL